MLTPIFRNIARPDWTEGELVKDNFLEDVSNTSDGDVEEEEGEEEDEDDEVEKTVKEEGSKNMRRRNGRRKGRRKTGRWRICLRL